MRFLMNTKQILFTHKLLDQHQRDFLELCSISDYTISKTENPIDSVHHLVCPIENHRDECPDRQKDDCEDYIEDVESVEHRRENYILFSGEWVDNRLVFWFDFCIDWVLPPALDT